MPIIPVMSSFCRLTLRRVSPRACLYRMPRCGNHDERDPRDRALAKRLRARILQASTSEIYGDPEMHPQGIPLKTGLERTIAYFEGVLTRELQEEQKSGVRAA